MTCTLVSEDGQCWSSSQHPTIPASSAHLFQRLGNIYFSAGQVNYAKALLFVTCLHLQSRHPSLFHDHVVASQGSLFSPKIGLFLKTNTRNLSFYRNAKVVFIEKSDFFLKSFKQALKCLGRPNKAHLALNKAYRDIK